VKPVWLVTYEAEDVSDELSSMVISAEYTDHLEGKSDELRITFEDRVGRWRGGWWPSEGDRIAMQMGVEGQPLLDAGEFQVVDCEARGAPDVITINALAAPQTGALRTKQSRAFEDTTLRDLISGLAGELELSVMGEVAALELVRVTQNQETTLALLRRLAKDYGYAFSIRPPYLVFYEIAALESADPIMVLSRVGLRSGWSLKGGPQDTYAVCELTWFDPATKELRISRVTAEHVREKVTLTSTSGATLTLPTRTLRNGVTGDDVRQWQTFLVRQSHDPGGIDGIFGPRTTAATRAFQTAHGIAVDGVVGPETRRAAVEAGYLTTPADVPAEPAGRVLRIEARVENAAQAEARALAELAAANRLRATGTLPLKVGDRRAVAGSTIELAEDFGCFGGRYLIQASKHNVARSGGYTAQAEVTYV